MKGMQLSQVISPITISLPSKTGLDRVLPGTVLASVSPLILQQPGHIPLLIGADCSVVVGTAQALMRVYGEEVHILYVDGDIDGVAPQPERCLSAAAMARWLAT
jgi:arginase family enzyme